MVDQASSGGGLWRGSTLTEVFALFPWGVGRKTSVGDPALKKREARLRNLSGWDGWMPAGC